MTRYLAIGAIFGFGLAVLLLAALGQERAPEAAPAVVEASPDAGRVALPLRALPLKDRILLPGSGFGPGIPERFKSPRMVPIGLHPVRVSPDGGQ